MSRRAPGSSEHAAQNQQKLKALVKIESNKSCADCKRNKHPRWASWNLGIFVCIRCSGIHRGMGTHISRVKSVDLDAWTDEQLQSMLRWGNARANKYWEAKLADGHIPSEAKIENFIRTKYESKRWVMEGGLPDPATLDVGEDESSSQPDPSPAPVQAVASPPPRRVQPATIPGPGGPMPANVDLFGDESSAAPAPPAKTSVPMNSPLTTKTEQPVPRQSKPSESLLGFDFLGNAPSGPPSRPTSTGPQQLNSNVPSRPDLKQSILSLYASNQRPTPPATQHTVSPPSSTSANLNDAFGSLSFSPALSTQPRSTAAPSTSSFGNLISSPTQKSSSTNAFNASSQPAFAGGNFFAPKPTPSSALNSQAASMFDARQQVHSSGFGDFTSATSPDWTSTSQASSGNTLTTAPRQTQATAPAGHPVTNPTSSAFDLSAPVTAPSRPITSPAAGNNAFASGVADPWVSNNNVWHSPGPTAASSTIQPKSTATVAASTSTWGSHEGSAGFGGNNGISTTSSAKAPIQVAGDEDFGGWESSTTVPAPAAAQLGSSFGGWESNNNVTNYPQQPRPNNTAPPPSKPGGGFASAGEDLFSNVWE